MNFGDPDDDMITCPDCGHKEYPQVGFGGHICQAAMDRAARETAAINAKYEGSGQRVRVAITVEFECYDTKGAFATVDHLMSLAGVFDRVRSSAVVKDDLLNVSGKFRKSIVKI